MGRWDKIKSLLNVSEDSDERGYDDEDDIVYKSPEKRGTADKSDVFTTPREIIRTTQTSKQPSESVKGGQIVDIHTTAKLQVVLTKPVHFDEASAVADNLIDKRTVVLNLESANREDARRLVDFLGGVAYANGGQLKKIAKSTFIITPYNVDVMGDLLDELESSGVFF